MCLCFCDKVTGVLQGYVTVCVYGGMSACHLRVRLQWGRVVFVCTCDVHVVFVAYALCVCVVRVGRLCAMFVYVT